MDWLGFVAAVHGAFHFNSTVGAKNTIFHKMICFNA